MSIPIDSSKRNFYFSILKGIKNGLGMGRLVSKENEQGKGVFIFCLFN